MAVLVKLLGLVLLLEVEVLLLLLFTLEVLLLDNEDWEDPLESDEDPLSFEEEDPFES